MTRTLLLLAVVVIDSKLERIPSTASSIFSFLSTALIRSLTPPSTNSNIDLSFSDFKFDSRLASICFATSPELPKLRTGKSKNDDKFQFSTIESVLDGGYKIVKKEEVNDK